MNKHFEDRRKNGDRRQGVVDRRVTDQDRRQLVISDLGFTDRRVAGGDRRSNLTDRRLRLWDRRNS